MFGSSGIGVQTRCRGSGVILFLDLYLISSMSRQREPSGSCEFTCHCGTLSVNTKQATVVCLSVVSGSSWKYPGYLISNGCDFESEVWPWTFTGKAFAMTSISEPALYGLSFVWTNILSSSERDVSYHHLKKLYILQNHPVYVLPRLIQICVGLRRHDVGAHGPCCYLLLNRTEYFCCRNRNIIEKRPKRHYKTMFVDIFERRHLIMKHIFCLVLKSGIKQLVSNRLKWKRELKRTVYCVGVQRG